MNTKRAIVVGMGLVVGLSAAVMAAEKKAKMKTGIPAAAKGFAGMIQGKPHWSKLGFDRTPFARLQVSASVRQ